MTNLLTPTEFDDWADSYDLSVAANSAFPFDGYSRVLQTIANLAAPSPGASVLDLGIGTGNLSLIFAKQNCEIWGIDFSAQMVALAQAKIPTATLGLFDLRAEWPSVFQRRFNYIVSAYTFHHFQMAEKVGLVEHLLKNYLTSSGKLVIGDIAFQDAGEEDALRCTLGSEWEQEYFWLADEVQTAFKEAGISSCFIKISSCAGIFIFQKCKTLSTTDEPSR